MRRDASPRQSPLAQPPGTGEHAGLAANTAVYVYHRKPLGHRVSSYWSLHILERITASASVSASV